MTKAIRWSDEQLAAYRARHDIAPGPPKPSPKKRGKYGSTKVDQDGITFDSTKEARRWAELEQLQRAGHISELKRQVAFELAPAVRFTSEPRKKPAIRYWADFTYMQGGQLVVEDTKSRPTRTLPAYRLKKHLLKTVHGLEIEEV